MPIPLANPGTNFLGPQLSGASSETIATKKRFDERRRASNGAFGIEQDATWLRCLLLSSSRNLASPCAYQHPEGRKSSLLVPEHTQKSRSVTNKGASEQEKKAAVALNEAAVWSHSCHPSGAFYSSRHAGFAAGVEHARWMGPERPTRDVHAQAECDAGCAARVSIGLALA